MQQQIKLVFSRAEQQRSRGSSKMSKKSQQGSLTPILSAKMRSLLKKIESLLRVRPELIPALEGVVDELIRAGPPLPSRP